MDQEDAEKIMEREKFRVERERSQPRELWRRDPAVDTPQDYA